MGKFTGRREKQVQAPIFSPEHIPQLNQLLSLLMGSGQGQQGLLKNVFGADASFGPIADEARTQFQQQTIPSIAERFSSLDGQRSSMFPQYLGQASSQLDQGLAAEGAKFAQRERALQMPLIQSLLGLAFQPRFQTVTQKATKGLLSNAMNVIPSYVKMFGGF